MRWPDGLRGELRLELDDIRGSQNFVSGSLTVNQRPHVECLAAYSLRALETLGFGKLGFG